MELGINSAHAQHNLWVLLKSPNIYNAPSIAGAAGNPSRACHGSKQKSFEDCPSETLTRPLVHWEHQTFLKKLNRTQVLWKRQKVDHLWKYCTDTNVLKSRGTVQNDNEKLSDPTSSSQWIVQHGKSYSKCILQGYWTKICFMPEPLSHHSGWLLSEVSTRRLMCLARWLICSPKPSSWQALATGCTSNTSER